MKMRLSMISAYIWCLLMSLADLIFAAIGSSPVSATQGTVFNFFYTIRNDGTAASGTSAAAYYVDQLPDTGHFLGYGITNPVSANGATQDFKEGGVSTTGLSIGQHTLWVRADNWDQVA